MVTPPFDVGHELQRHGDALRQLAFDLVLDSNAADDAVQEVCLAALQRPPRHQDALFGWLATALHNVVRMWRRKQRRRDRHEAEAAAARDTIDRGEARSREELGRELLRAVESLEAPYRDAIWQRFFEGKPPRAIAASSGVPLATVKSRLQRGLGMLRERLAADGSGGDWRRAFAVAFGLRETAAAASAAALATGGVLVATWAKMAALAAAAVAISAIWWWPQDDVTAPVAPDRVEHVAAAPATTAARPAPGAALEAAAVAREAAPPPPLPADANTTTLRGRCVDEAGLPVAGCTVTVGGSVSSRAQMDAWLNGNPTAQWRDPTPVTTGADGAFAFTFVPPPPYRFWLAAEAPGLAWMGANWHSIDGGKVLAIGDVVMQPGIELRGHVVDADGSPCPDAGWQLQPEPRDVTADDGAVNPTSHLAGRCRADGTFVASRRFAAGTYQVQASEGDRESDAQRLVLMREQPVAEVTLQVKGRKQPAITGCVVDAQGQPVRSARIVAGAAVASTNRDGRFTLRRPMDESTGTASLRATAEGYETRDIAEPIAWGTAGVDVVLRLRAALVLSVRDERDAPVVDYTVRCIPGRDTGDFGGGADDARVRARGPHADGVATVPGVSGGTWRIVLQFPADSGLPPWIEDVEIPAAGKRLDVRPQALARRWLRVVMRDGAPVAGTRVQVIDIPRERRELALDCVTDTDTWLATSGFIPSRIAFETQTDARGMCEVQGQRGRTLGLLLLGPGHAPLAQDDLSLDDASELVVEVARGARLTGRLTPPDALAQLVRYDLTDPAQQSLRPTLRPTLRLLPANGQRSFTMRTRAGEVDSPSVTVAADGSYACESKPAGAWRVVVEYMRSTGTAVSNDRVEVARIDLHDGQEAQLDLDLGWLMPAELEATVTWNGVPFANAKVRVASHHGGANGDPDSFRGFDKATDEHGTFRMMVRPGTFFVTLKSAADGSSTAPLRCPVPAVVVGGRTTAHTFDFTSGKLHVTLVDAAGKPAEGVVVYAGGNHDGLPATDASGSAIGESIAGARLLRALPKAVAAKMATQPDWSLAWRDDAFDGQWLELGTVTVLAGTTTEVALRLPPEWDRQ